MKKFAFVIFFSFFFAAALSAADKLVNVSDAGSNCPSGGIKIEVGPDANGDNEIDEPAEETKFVCNGENGEDGSAPAVSIAPADVTDCSGRGGIVVTVGSDELPVCNGQAGADALINTTELAADSGECPCSNGCIKIEAGLDNKTVNGVLDANEVTKTEYACNGENGAAGANGKNALSKITEITNETTSCKNGGVKIEVGIDADGSGTLEANEIDNNQTKYVCNGTNGKNGATGPTGPKGEDGTDGKDGAKGDQGDKGDQGPKGDQGEQGETGATGANGKNGAGSVVSVVDEPKGENCAAGGKKIEVGLDANGNGALDEDEIDPESVYYVCNGRDAEEAGLASSSTGCSLESIDENGTLMSVVFALMSIVFAIFVLRKARS
ncbi:collagen-like protein [bacterium]|nr:collagen-like protein [bacterium]